MRYIIPVLNEFPIWRYGAIYDYDGRYVRAGWRPTMYSEREITRAEADAIRAKQAK